MSVSITLSEAKAQLSRLVDRAAAGEEIIITKAGHPLARLVPLKPPSQPRVPGLLRGQIRMGEDFNAPLSEELAEPAPPPPATPPRR